MFVSSQTQLPTFDRVFGAVFDPALEPDEERGDPHSPTLSGSQPSERPPSPKARSVPGEHVPSPGRHAGDHIGALDGTTKAREVEGPWRWPARRSA